MMSVLTDPRLSQRLKEILTAKQQQGFKPLYEQSLAEAREADLRSIQDSSGLVEEVSSVAALECPGPGGPIPLRLYKPHASGAPLPMAVYFFGGGWVLGTIDTSDAICRSLANKSGCAVIAVGYRLAPEHPFPAAIEDAFAACDWVANNAARLGLDGTRLAVAGDSAGGNLAACVSLIARDRGGPAICFQALIYPNTDQTAEGGSMALDDPLIFNRRSVAWYRNYYFRDLSEASDPSASPALAPDHRGLPAALIITAEFDPIRDQGERYAELLRQAGVTVQLTRYHGMIYGFFTMQGILDDARRAHREVADAMRSALRP